ncbi:hypothetical protein [Cohaesibacter celericrescens]|nr:hypothetical protein [Cohaesibacter celericrescens]
MTSRNEAKALVAGLIKSSEIEGIDFKIGQPVQPAVKHTVIAST